MQQHGLSFARNDTRVNLLLMMADLRSTKAGPEPNGSAPLDAPMFLWEQFADRIGTPADRAALRGVAAANGDAPTPSAVMSDAFTSAVLADGMLRPEEREALLAARKSDRSADGAPAAIALAEKSIKTAPAKAYLQYLRGAAAFWQADYGKAGTIFPLLVDAQPAWVRETALYMAGRTLINHAQVGAFDQYGSFREHWKADPGIVAAAEAALDRYLQQYPRGAYAQSARGLKRRGYWLAQDTGKLQEEYSALILLPPAERNISDVELVQEIDNKLFSAQGTRPDAPSGETLIPGTRNPLLLAALDLLAMRADQTADGIGAEPKRAGTLTLAALETQKPRFAADMPLYEYLLAVHALYAENRPAEVLRMIPDAARQGSYNSLQFSRQVIRGLSLEAVKDRNALGFWIGMLPGATGPYQRPALELAVAYHDERNGKIRDVFLASSPVHYPYLREVLLANVADADLLRAQAENVRGTSRERALALFTLLFKEATRGKATDFLKDVALVPSNAPTSGAYMLDDVEDTYFAPDEHRTPADIPLGIFLHDQTESGFGCPGIRATEEQLAKEANSPMAQLCLADFVRLNPAVTYLIDPQIRKDELGGTPSLFPGGPYVRMATYTAVLANPRSSRNDKAYALYRAVNCYASSGNNQCGGAEIPKAQRKAWFTTLKRDYAGTRWANALQYYW